jgi:ribokinase
MRLRHRRILPRFVFSFTVRRSRDLPHRSTPLVPHIALPGETISSATVVSRPGGKGANQAASIARAGGRVSLVGAVGQDGGWVKDAVAAHGVDVHLVNQVEGTLTGRAIVQVTPEGENAIVLFPGANHSAVVKRECGVQDLMGNLTGPSPRHILLQNEIDFEATLNYIQHALATQVWIFNPSPVPSPAQVSRIPWGRIDWLIVNVHEAGQLFARISFEDPSMTGSNGNLPAEWLDLSIPQETLYTLHRLTSLSILSRTSVICTLGSLGVVGLSREGHLADESTASEYPKMLAPVYVPAVALREVRDSTGAGDCFTGYFVAGLMRLWDENERPKRVGEREALEALLKECCQVRYSSCE